MSVTNDGPVYPSTVQSVQEAAPRSLDHDVEVDGNVCREDYDQGFRNPDCGALRRLGVGRFGARSTP